MKIPFLFNVGCAYCATSPLWRTLQHDTKYLHTGHRKKTHWLYVLQYQDQFQWNREQQDNKGALASYNRWQGRASKFLAVPRGHLISDNSREETKFTREEDNYFFSLPTSIEKYIEYYKRHWDYLDGEYKSVGDFSNKPAIMDEDYLCYLRDALSDHFDIKVTMIFRDPVREIWSNAFTQYDRIYTPKGNVQKSSLYHEIYEKHVRVWGKDKVFPMVMERIWEDPTELSNFLNHPIPKMHRNVYYPERGTDRDEFSEFPDQWVNEKNPIDYDRMRKEFDWLYKSYEKTFGEIPSEWCKKDIDK